jgi:hypothetical protein
MSRPSRFAVIKCFMLCNSKFSCFEPGMMSVIGPRVSLEIKIGYNRYVSNLALLYTAGALGLCLHVATT